ncbi:hypothetical protein RQCS_28320 [Rhodococcus qingshengii]|uniref:hypothetical protein n=1 Tax=Rhodococcus qingshengii TaxID=334542 RepID=UPI0009EE51EE|nr:hypothetical protein [Rhodococcus qingshengii]BCF83287.1 hypothetical protein RQCS_28320 [Rhodococcus qingshengii]
MKGSRKDIRPDDLTVQMVAAEPAKLPELDLTDIVGQVLNSVLPDGMQGDNLTRIVAVLPALGGRMCSTFCRGLDVSAGRELLHELVLDTGFGADVLILNISDYG